MIAKKKKAKRNRIEIELDPDAISVVSRRAVATKGGLAHNLEVRHRVRAIELARLWPHGTGRQFNLPDLIARCNGGAVLAVVADNAWVCTVGQKFDTRRDDSLRVDAKAGNVKFERPLVLGANQNYGRGHEIVVNFDINGLERDASGKVRGEEAGDAFGGGRDSTGHTKLEWEGTKRNSIR
eukprot:GABV01008577.1.p2 GENE.GABV01008577.1~~GABV01008577.1.p2  ORF type:complete len:181 (-),score=38.33 GABV01008577.1:735-1277(-)